MKVLVVGSGGREHAIVWRVQQSAHVTEIFCAPGNAGIAEMAKCVSIKADDIDGLAQFAQANSIDLTVVGSESPLVKGIVDLFAERGLKIFGPSKAAAQVEGSKMFLKHFLERHNIPTAKYQTFNQSELDSAVHYIRANPSPYVIKTDGLAAGKGVAICQTAEEAVQTVNEYFQDGIFGDAGRNIVIEEFMTGEEASVFAICDGENYVLLSSAQDHKQILDGDKGKNTGGMGAYAPAPIVTKEILVQVEHEIIQPTLAGMKSEGHPYKGCLYVGLMITTVGPKVVEYNCRLGDPETQVLMPLIESDPYELFDASATGTISSYPLKLRNESAVCVVMASQGYPDEYEVGKEVSGIAEAEKSGAVVFHAGTKKENGKILTAGGRVFGITTLGNDLQHTIEKTYTVVKKIKFEGAYFRTDIGKKGLKKL